MPAEQRSPRHGTCRICRCSIISQGRGWYHTAERPTSPYSGHFAEPLTPAGAGIAVFTPADAIATVQELTRHLGLVGELA